MLPNQILRAAEGQLRCPERDPASVPDEEQGVALPHPEGGAERRRDQHPPGISDRGTKHFYVTNDRAVIFLDNIFSV